MNNTIYPSEKVLPYVYIGFHKVTGHFYIGSRYGQVKYLANNIPSHLDLGFKYFTSSKEVKKLGFDNFNWTILAEFFDSDDAYAFEIQLINEHLDNPLNLNFHAGKRFRFNIPHSDEGKMNISKAVKNSWTPERREAQRQRMLGKKMSEETKKKISDGNKGEKNGMYGKGCPGELNGMYGKKHSTETLAKMSESHSNVSEETRKKLSRAAKGKTKPRGKDSSLYGRKHSPETKAKMAEKRKLYWENRRKGSNYEM